jgi:hypothetical protein
MRQLAVVNVVEIAFLLDEFQLSRFAFASVRENSPDCSIRLRHSVHEAHDEEKLLVTVQILPPVPVVVVILRVNAKTEKESAAKR